MSTKSRTKFHDIEKAFDDVFSFENEADQIDLDAKVLMSRFLSEVFLIADEKNLNKKQLAEMIGTSASYLTQLNRGNKALNFITLAKLQRALNISFEISACREEEYSVDSRFLSSLEDWMSKQPKNIFIHHPGKIRSLDYLDCAYEPNEILNQPA